METSVIHALPTPTDTPYRTPTSALSYRSGDFMNMSPTVTPPPLPSADFRLQRRRSNESPNPALDDSISPLDPRRFTPNLHANLVSEILSLRRELEDKTKDIDRLEQNLHATQIQNESLSISLTASNKEVRSTKRQMQLLESGTLSAITDLSKERDSAAEDVVDLRKRLEHTQKKIKTQSETINQTQQLWTQEKETWTLEKRSLETKVHVVEGRLKVVLNELATSQAATTTHVERDLQRPESRASTQGSPVKRPSSGVQDRRLSATSDTSDHAGGRTSTLSFTNAGPVNLADELAFEEMDALDEADLVENDEGRISPNALPEERARPASSLSIKARKVLGLPFDFEDMEHGERRQSVGDALNLDGATKVASSSSSGSKYVDSAVQPTAPEIRIPKVVMVSSSCQTSEQLPSPPTTPRHEAFLATIHESLWEKPEVKAIATQTDGVPQAAKTFQYVHSRTDTHDLGIPSIAIIPPVSRPSTPKFTVVLPPHTKNASCQVEKDLPTSYKSTSMQTEEIRIDRRNLFYSQPDLSTSTLSQSQATASRGKSTNFSRRTSQPTSNSAMKRSAPPVPAVPTLPGWALDDRNDDATKADVATTNDLSVGSGDQHTDVAHMLDDDIFDDTEVFQRPTARYTLRSGKIVSQERSLEDLGKLAAISAGETVALENLRQSEDALSPELRDQLEAMSRNKSTKRAAAVRRGQSSAARSNSSSMRRTAMISNGTAVHHHQHRHSLSTNASSDGSGAVPPLPIPLRFSSARLAKSYSEGGRTSRSSNASPTRQGRRVTKPVLRKTRSGPNLSPTSAVRRQRSKSPPLDSRISIVPEMPVFDMPSRSKILGSVDFLNSSQDAIAPRPSIATGPSRQSHHAKTNSEAPLAQQNSVVEAIAQSMVGEWMFKYVRRRKSFGKPEKDWDPNKSADELINNPGSAGVRHKRWVWVAPYERAIMWSSKQPMNGTALLGKSGRKLTIKSVLDVKDDNPMPKGSLITTTFNRSILILTPQRALKFTATNQERHYLWLTALSFLSHSPLSVGDLAALPPPNDVYHEDLPSPSLAGSLPKKRIRDSIRLAKATNKPTISQNTFLSDITMEESFDFYGQRPATSDMYDQATDAALPPVIKRFHTRKRSNTAPKAPPSAFRTFPPIKESTFSGQFPDYSNSGATTDRGSSEQGPFTPSLGHPSFPSTRRGSEASGLSRPGKFSIFDSNSSHNASMTMRMDAFIENKQAGKIGHKSPNHAQGEKANERRKEPALIWGFDDSGMPNLSPDVSAFPDANFRYSESTGRGSEDRDHFRNF